MNSNTKKQLKKPWERWPDETDLGYHRFTVYLELGPERSLEGVRQKVGKSRAYKRQLEKWSSKYNWVQRAGEYDRYVFENVLKHKKEILDKGMARLLGMMDKALDELENVLEMDDVLYLGEGGTSILNQKIKAIDSVLNRIGLIEQKELPLTNGGNITINNYVQNIYNKLRRLDSDERKEEAQ